jgi:Protein of unknown function (DUF1684)
MAGTDNARDGTGNTAPRQITPADLKPGTSAWRVNVAMCAHQFFGLVHNPEIAAAIGKPAPAPDPDGGPPTTVITGAVVEVLEHHHNAIGVIDFELAGATLQLVAFSRQGGELHVLFTDATSGVTTYPAADRWQSAPRTPTAR